MPKNQLQVAKYDEWYTLFFFEWLRRTNGLVVKTGCRESGDMGSIPDEFWNPLPRLGHFAWHWARQCTDTRAFYIAAAVRPLYIFFLGFRQWRSRADRVVNLNTTIRLPLFWRTWTRARASTRPHVLAWHMGRDYSDCRASELTDRQVSGFVYSWFLENTEKTKASSEAFLRLTPQTAYNLHYITCIIFLYDLLYSYIKCHELFGYITCLWVI